MKSSYVNTTPVTTCHLIHPDNQAFHIFQIRQGHPPDSTSHIHPLGAQLSPVATFRLAAVTLPLTLG